MTLPIVLAAAVLVRQTEYPFKPDIDNSMPVRYFRIIPGAAPEPVKDNWIYATSPDPKRVRRHAIEGRELRAFWAKPSPPPFPLPDPPRDYADWLERFAAKESADAVAQYRFLSADSLVSRFVENRDGHTAFEVFVALTAEGNRAHPYSECTKEEAEYFLRYAANHGSVRARRFFDESGELKSGREYEYVFAEYSPNYRRRRSYEYDMEGAPGNGMSASFRAYDADGELAAQLERHSLEAGWCDFSFPEEPDPNAAAYKQARARHLEGNGTSCSDALPPSLPFLAFRPKPGGDPVPLVVYMPGNGEQGADLKLQFRQTACMAKVASAEFQERHPAYLLVIAPPSYGNVNIGHGYPSEPNGRVSEEYNDLVLAFARNAVSPRIDPSRIYVTGLGSGASIAIGMALDHPGRFAAVAPVWGRAPSETVHPRMPGNWRFYNRKGAFDKYADSIGKVNSAFAENVRECGGDCSFHDVPDVAEGCWWDAVWSSDEVWDWMFSKRTGSAGKQ